MVRDYTRALWGIIVILALLCPALSLKRQFESQSDEDLIFEDTEEFIHPTKEHQNVIKTREKRQAEQEYSHSELGSGDYGIAIFRASIPLNDRMHPEYSDTTSLRYVSLIKRLEMDLKIVFQQLSGKWDHHITSIGDSGDGRITISIDFIHTEGDNDIYDVRDVLSEVLRSSNNLNVNIGLLKLNRVEDHSSGQCEYGEELCPNGECVPRCDGVAQCVGGGDEIGCNIGSPEMKERVYRASVVLIDRVYRPEYPLENDEATLRSAIETQLTDALVRDGLVKLSADSFGITTGNRLKVEIHLLFRESSVTTLASRRSRFIDALQDTKDLRNVDLNEIHFRTVRDVGRDKCLAREALCDDGKCVERCDGSPDCDGGEDELECSEDFEEFPAVHIGGGDFPVIPVGPRSCTNEEFKCNDGKCIEGWRRCDFIQDCSSNEDELNCSCKPPRYQCISGMCIDGNKRCDGIKDCDDLSDENLGCQDDACDGSGMFTCDDGDTCLEDAQICDGTVDCDDSTDEADCDHITTIPPPVECTPGLEFECADGRCLSIDLKCNGNVDCTDGSDEKDCPNNCEPDQYKCNDGLCLRSNQKCDGHSDCSEGEDELSCSCRSSDFRCANGQCVDLSTVCNGLDDCFDASDELNCPTTSLCPSDQFSCRNGQCISIGFICDGVPDCNDGSDELSETCGQPSHTCSPTEFQCNHGNCIDINRRCDSSNDCLDGSDERGCPDLPTDSLVCTEGQFRCGDGMCIEKEWKCDGMSDCNDSSDELECSCKFGEFKCGSGECITESIACDGKKDCQDGSDEKGCRICESTDFYCKNGECIAFEKKCDKVNDCGDNSDEEQCSQGACGEGEFVCRGGGCVPESMVCNRASDCSDGSDEDPSLCTKCASYEFECSSGQCIFATQRCNGRPECSDRSDEIGCPGLSQCGSYEYKCQSGECISNAAVCDRRNDCLDNSDEANCTGIGAERVCDGREFTCSDGSCVALFARCDGRYDCYDGSDELDCSQFCDESQFSCTDGHCISKLVQCDGRRDCLDGSDESNCPVSSICGPSEFGCRDGRQCIPSNKRCNIAYDCQDGSDEENCPTTCRLDEYKCSYGGCIPLEQRCNINYDCPDGSDEFNCPAGAKCGPYQYACTDGRQCIDVARRCDRNFDCIDKSDEENCPGDGECRPDQYACRNGECIEGNLRCDNTYDCTDGTDEYGCTTTQRPVAPTTSRPCSISEFRCRDGQQCIDLRGKCNGYFDCFDRSDEQDCAPERCHQDQFTCESGDCVNSSVVCNGIYDCPDTSDEDNCLGKVTCSPTNEFACRNGRQCVAKSGRCNQQFECIDRSDEENCEDTYTCPNGDQIPINLMCDGYNDCPDGSDEYGCDKRCEDDQFLCQSSAECIPRRLLCNGAYDCLDRSDEEYCTSGVKPEPPTRPSGSINLVTMPENQSIEQGRQVVFRCRDEGDTRAPVRWVRQGHNILPPRSTDARGRLTIDDVQISYSGDYYCEAQGVSLNAIGRRKRVHLTVIAFVKPTLPPDLVVCAYNQTTCRSGMCVSKAVICDGKFDCDDQSDEDRCNQLGCEPNEFECNNRQCVQKSWVCDSDADCLDGSDEVNCGARLPGQTCERTEFVCQENDQCIPKSFVCDNEMDCIDGSDEFGCSKPIISESPDANLLVEIGQTFTIICRAVGMPIPEINWRYNWAHVPSTCTSTSINGLGTLTCVNVQINYQGAYSCEATNSLGRTFVVPDTIVKIKETEGTGVCTPPLFNAGAVSRRDCMQCFCFGVTDQCTSTDQFTTQLPAPTGAFKIIGVNQDQHQGFYVIRVNEYPISSSYIRTISSERIQIFISDRGDLGGPTDLLLYFSLPDSYKGSQIGSYGGYIRYQISHRVSSGFGQTVQGPDAIIRGNNITIMYVSSQTFRADVDTQVDIRLWPGQWYKRVAKKGGRIQSQELATRDDIMNVLQNIELILIRASYSDGLSVEATLNSVHLDSISYTTTSLGRSFYVESCRCPIGYTGMSCEECAQNYRRIYDGTILGRCTLNISCGPTEFGDPSRGIPCQLCPCPLTNPSNQFSQSCYLDADGQVTCRCQTGYSGRRCETCTSGYIGNPSIPGDSCRPTGQCDKDGSHSIRPDPITGLCRCKEHTTGPKCSQCKASSYHLNENSRHGCIRCFCMGVSNTCTSSNWYRTQEVIGFVADTQGFLLVDQYQTNTIMNSVHVDVGTQELVYTKTHQLSPEVYYWKLPSKFVKDKVTAYGGNLTYTFRYTASQQPLEESAPYDVEIYGNDITMRYYNPNAPPQSRQTHTITVPLYESYWKRRSGQSGNREHFLMALADLEYILIRATYSADTIESSLKEVRLDYATSRNTGQQRALAVESCDCPQGYKGLSCEDCAAGYTRQLTALYLGECRICNCNGHSEECDPETGICMNCRNNRAGEYCERCSPGFTEEYSGICVRRSGCSCDSKGSISSECVDGKCICKDNVEGEECKTCLPGYFHLSEMNTDGCLKCWCSDVTDHCTSSYLSKEQIPMNLFDNHNFTLTNRSRKNVITDLSVNIAVNQITFEDFNKLRTLETYYWSLPQLFTGNKLNSYGGYLRVKQSFASRSANDLFADADIIIIGADQKEFVWMDDMGPMSNSMHKNISVRLTEENFSHNQAPARREDFLSALASVEAILVRATLSVTITSSSLRDVIMDTAVDYSSGQSRALEVEQCSCPIGHVGNSCEDCAQGYYKDSTNRCLRCVCSGKEQSCSLDQNRRLLCICLPGYSGDRCEISGAERPLPVGIFEVRIPQSEYIVEEGGTIELLCRVSTPVSYQMTIAWDKIGGTLPIRRVRDDRRGTLTITQVRQDDSGEYVCRASTGVQVKEARTYLNVTGGLPSSKPIVVIDEHREEVYIRIGEFIRLRCRARGTPTPEVQWYREDGQALSFAVTQVDGILTFNNPQRGDTGTYICLGRNREGSTQTTIKIHVEEETRLPPIAGDYIIVQVPENVEVHAGSLARIDCRVPATLVVLSYKWTRMQLALPQGATQVRGELIIPEAKAADSGMYTCTVTDSKGKTGKSTTYFAVLPSGTPPDVRIEPERQTINQGTNAELKCIVVGQPQPTIKWTKENEVMSRNARIQNDILIIENAEVNDRGLYRCTAVNINGEGRSVAILEVELREPPVIEMYPDTRATIRKGESASFLCHLTKGYPTPSISWARTDGRPLTPNTETPAGGVIKFYQVTGTEEGSYICTVKNDAGKMTATAVLEIESVPVITLRPASRSITVQAGQRIRLECSADGDPSPAVSWQKLLTNLPQDIPTKSVTPRVTIYEVASARMSDQAVYQCTAKNNAGTSVERVQVIVQETNPSFHRPTLPTSSDTNRQFQVPLGGQFEFRCVIEGIESDIQNYSYEFRRSDGRALPREHVLGSRTLTVSNVDRSVQGEYACIITELATHQTIITIYANLEVIDPPRITLEPTKQVVRPGDNANLRCSVTGDQPISIKWSKQVGSMPSSVVINGGMLMFRGIQVTDAGKYLCEAVNPVGTAEAVAEVLVNERPLLTSLQHQVTLSEGQDGELRCIPSGLPSSAVHWNKDGTTLPSNFRAAGSVLRIYQVSSENSGRYKCEANTQTGDYTYDYVELVVQRSRAVDVQVRPSSEVVKLGDNVDLYCVAMGQPQAYITWSKDGGLLPYNARVNGSRLHLVNVDQSSGGVYVCSAQTELGVSEMKYPLTIQQNALSATRSVETRSVKFGSSITLRCGAVTSASDTFTWAKLGGQLPSRAVIQEEFLEIPDVEADDSGTYVCSSGSGLSRHESPTLLVVTGVVPSFNGQAYLALPTLDSAYLFFDIELSIKPERENGLVLYNAQQDGRGDFISFGLNNSFAEFRFDVGSGPAVLRSLRPLQLGEWHTVKLTRNRKEGTLSVNGGPVITGKSQGRFQGLDLIQPLYIGGVPDFAVINKQAGFSSGFDGCISQLLVGTKNTELMRNAVGKKVVEPCNTCSDDPCHNGGVCQEAYSATGHKCICAAGFSGVSCQSTGEECYPGVCGTGRCVNILNGFYCKCPFGTAGHNCELVIDITEPSFGGQSYLAYRTPRALKRFSIGLSVKPNSLEDGIIMYCAQQEKGDGDFASLTMKDNRLEFRFNTGTGTAILRSGDISPGSWVKVFANRTDQTGSLQINDGKMQNVHAPGSSRALNLRTPLYFGGVDKSRIEITPEVKVDKGFVGCMSNLDIMDQPVGVGAALLDSANIEQCGTLPCSRNPCRNGGTCHANEDSRTKYRCLCKIGFSGYHCQIRSALCGRQNPCKNGATCEDISISEFKCHCPLGFSGHMCHEESYLQESAAFSGNSWLELDRYMVPTDGISEQEFTLDFSTVSPSGLLLWFGQDPTTAGRGKDFISLGVVNGYLQLSLGMGGDIHKVTSEERIDDGYRHTAVIKKISNVATLSVDNGKLLEAKAPESSFSFNTYGNIYIGGTPNLDLMTSFMFSNGFDGCIHRMVFGRTAVYSIMNTVISGVNVAHCQDPNLHDNQIEEQYPSVFKRTSITTHRKTVTSRKIIHA